MDHTAVQTIINFLFTVAGALGAWIMKFFYDKLHDLSVQDMLLADKVQHIEVLVAGEYVKKSELIQMQNTLLNKLDRIESKLDGKMDKL